MPFPGQGNHGLHRSHGCKTLILLSFIRGIGVIRGEIVGNLCLSQVSNFGGDEHLPLCYKPWLLRGLSTEKKASAHVLMGVGKGALSLVAMLRAEPPRPRGGTASTQAGQAMFRAGWKRP